MMKQRRTKLHNTAYFAILFFWFFLFLPPSVLKAQIQGRVFRDINASGVFDSTATFREVGVSGITVTAYNSAGVSVGTTTTNSTGNYTIPSVSGAARVEFTGLASTDFAGHQGTGSNTSIQFVNAPTTGVNFGINDPDWYWDSSKDPRYVLPCYVNGTASGTGSADPAIVSLPYSSTGLNSFYQDYNGVQGTGPMPRVDASFGSVGTVWGTAYNRKQKHYYFSTFLKRHCGMADGPGYVYNFDYSGPTASLTGKFNLQGVTPANGGAAIDLGSVTRTGSSDYTLATDKNSPSRDIDAFGKVAAMSFGDCDMQANTDYLWLVNCYQKALIRVNVSSNPTSVPVGGVEQYILSSLPGYPTSTKGILRPWALKFTSNKGYLGLVDDASISGNDADLRAIVLEFDPNNIAAGFTTKLNFDPNPKRIATGGTWLLFKSWLNTYSEANVIVSGQFRARAQPVLSDIEFDERGNMYLSFFDRFGHQTGFFNYLPLSGSTTIIRTNSYGEIDIACKTATGWEIEGTGACYPTTAEFIQDISGDDERESSEGATALLKGKNELLQVSIDPHPQGSTGSAYWNMQGTNTYNLTTGAISNWYSVYQSSDVELFGKANGLGDTEFMIDPAPIEIGNRMWADLDHDGIQDAGEAGLSGIQIQLYQGTTLISTVTTDVNGQYLFTNLLPNTAYQIRVNLSQSALSGIPLSNPNVGTNDLIDSDMTQSGSTGIINVTTGNYGENSHTYDIGFQIPSLPSACDLGTGNPFNLIVFDASTISNGSDVTGKALFGGNITITGYAVGTSFTSNQGDVLLVNGNLIFNTGQTNWGNVKATGTISGNFTAANGTKIPNTTLPVNVTTIRNELESRSTYWGTLANQNGTATLPATGLLTLDCLNSTGQVILNVTAAQIASCWGVEIINGANAQGILINVSGTSVDFSSKALNTYPSQTKIVWNFYQATTININAVGIKGTVLAPFAAATFNNGHVDGNVIFRTMSGNGETHNYLFNGSLPCAPSCNNFTSAGTVGSNQSGCGTSLDPANLTEITAPVGGTGTLEFQWQISTDNITWTDIVGAVSSTYDPPTITATRYYRRGVRRNGCTTYLYSNAVTVSVNPIPTVAPTANTPCLPDILFLVANASVSSGTITNYAWVGPSSGWTSSLANPHRIAGDVGALGVYTVTVTSSGGCTAIGSVTVTGTNAFTVSNIPAATTVQCTSNVPTTSPTFVANCCNPVTVKQYNSYPNCPNPNIVTNNGFETVGTATFPTTFQGYPAQQLVNNSTVIPGWEMGFDNCTPSCSPGYWVYDNTNTINNPEGSRFIYLGGGNNGGYCAVSNSTLTLAANECAEICFNGAAWATSGLQVPTSLQLEYSLNGSSTFQTAFSIMLPPSTSFQNMNWQDICLNFNAPSAGTYYFVFTVETEDASNPAAGMALDNIRVKKCCSTNPNTTSCNYTFTKNWLATDGCGNQEIVSQQVTVNDTQAPTLSGVPADVTVCTTPPSVAAVTATDNCQGAITPVYTQTSTQTSNGSCTDNNYTLTRKWTATDACGNATTGTQIITIVTPSVSVAGATTICTGGSLTLTASINCSLAGTYQWQIWNGSIWVNTGTNSTILNTGTLTATAQYRVNFTTTIGSCVATTAATVTVVADPSVSVSMPPAAVCVGANVTLTATSTVGTGTCTVQWQSSPDGTTWTDIGGATGNSYNVINLSATTRYRAQLVSCTGNGCCN